MAAYDHRGRWITSEMRDLSIALGMSHDDLTEALADKTDKPEKKDDDGLEQAIAASLDTYQQENEYVEQKCVRVIPDTIEEAGPLTFPDPLTKEDSVLDGKYLYVQVNPNLRVYPTKKKFKDFVEGEITRLSDLYDENLNEADFWFRSAPGTGTGGYLRLVSVSRSGSLVGQDDRSINKEIYHVKLNDVMEISCPSCDGCVRFDSGGGY